MKKIMVVDDNHSIREMFRALLREWEYQPVLMESGKEAIYYMKEHVPDIIITDYNLGGWPNGIDIAHFAKQSNIPVIMLSANENAAILADKEGIPFLMKPPNFVELKGVIEKELLKRR